MCYAKPGPRCSPHAKRALTDARKEFLAVADDNKKAYAAYTRLQAAQKDYDLTPAGQAEIQTEILNEADAIKKYELQRRLDKAIQQRQTALRAARSKDVGDIPHNAKSQGMGPALIPNAPVPNSGNRYNPHSLGGFMSASQLPYEYETDYDEDHYSSVDLRGFTREVTPDDWFALAYDLNTPTPASFYEEFKGFRFEDHLTPEVTNGYYGEEFAGFKVSDELREKTAKVFYSQPDADDYLKGFEYARQEGVDTTGLTPVEAIKTVAKKNSHSGTPALLNNATKLKAEVLNLDSVKLDNIIQAPATPYDYRGMRSEATPSASAGVVVKSSAGEYILVHGAERFKAAQETKRNTWLFHVLY